MILNTELSAKNKMQAVGSLAVPVLRYSFGIINWHQEEIQKLDRKTRKMLTIHEQHHPRADIDRLYVPRKEGGRGLMQVEGGCIAETVSLVEYVESKEDPLIQIVRRHQHNTNSACPILENEYVIRHDKVCTHIHYSICKTLGIETTENWYSHIPKRYVNMKI
jgi:hypothetical protein